MKIKEIISQSRRDFRAIYVCEHCGYEKESNGYDDRNFHTFVILKMECDRCGKIAPNSYRPLATKYADNVII